MDKKYVDERNIRTTNSITKMFVQMIIITLLVCSAECGLLMRLYQYIIISRFDMIAFTIVIGGFFGILYVQIFKGAKKYIHREMRMFKFCIDCAIEHAKIPQMKAESTKLQFGKPRINTLLFVGKAKDFKGF